MAVTTDRAALDEWVVCGWPEKVAVGADYRTVVFGQEISVHRKGPDAFEIFECGGDGRIGRQLPAQVRYCCVFTTLGEPARPLPAIAEFDEPDRRTLSCGSVGVHTSPFRIIENFLDMAHFSFVHTDILGAAERTEVLAYKTEHRKDVDEIWAIDCQFFQPAASKASKEGQMTHYAYRVMSPFSVMLYKNVFGDPTRNDAICVFVQPIGETECLAYMPMALVDPDSSLASIIDFQQTIFLQDRVILENQRPALLPLDPTIELPTRADASSIAFRRWLKAKNFQFGIYEKKAA
jgi:phenylpropionate dioxygenase-like ring-hydroxylating dioxygenase large terminal subunit